MEKVGKQNSKWFYLKMFTRLWVFNFNCYNIFALFGNSAVEYMAILGS